jgi:DNA repair exonuclease SbcCD ATPase subunit
VIILKDIDIKGNIVRRNRIPILIYTPDWIQLFSNYRSKNMQRIIGKLEELLSKEKKLEEELKEAEKKKKMLMNKILHLSNELNENSNNPAIDMLVKAQKEILSINTRIPQILEELEEIPFAIDSQNTELLKETIKRTYELINESKREADITLDEINKIRENLGNLIKKKVDLEERVNKLYSYLHGIMGASEMEKLDESLLKDE